MKSLKNVFLGILSIGVCSQAAAVQKGGDVNGIRRRCT